MAARVTVVGSINLDLVVAAERLPERGETVLGTDLQRFGGGKGANQALAAAKMGASVAMVAKVGTDEAGRMLVGDLLRAGVEIGHIGRAEGPTGTAIITVEPSGTNTIVVAAAANMLLTPDDVLTARGVIAGSDAVLLQLEVPMETVVTAARVAREAGVPVFLNPSPVRDLPDDLLDGLAYLVVNEREIEALTHGSGLHAELFDRGVRAIVLTLGERGARFITPERDVEVAPFRVPSVDSTAAGDAFLGALAATLPELGIDGALQAASAAGALATTRWGAQPSLPTRDEVNALLLTRNVRRRRR